MTWIKTVTKKRCPIPMFWSFKEIGSQWKCPNCGKIYTVRKNPDEFWGGKILAPDNFRYTPYNKFPNMECR